MASRSELWSTAVTEPCGPTCAARLIPGSPVPLARSMTRMPGNGREYATRASVTARPIAADFAFHFSAATRRNEEPHGAGFEADISDFLFTRFLGRRRRGCGFDRRRPPRLRFGQQFRRLQAFGRLPQAFQIVELAGFFGENMNDEVDVVKQHPLRLFVALGVSYAQAECFQSLVYGVGNGLDLPGIRAAAHHKIVGEGSRVFFQLENRDILRLFVLAGEEGFSHLVLEVVLFSHTGVLIVTCGRRGRGERRSAPLFQCMEDALMEYTKPSRAPPPRQANTGLAGGPVRSPWTAWGGCPYGCFAR